MFRQLYPINIRVSIRVRGMHLALGAEPVKINRVPKKVPENVWEALVQSQVRFNRVPGKVPEKVEEKVPGGFGAEPGQVQQGSGEASREGLGGFGAEPGQQTSSEEGSGEGSGKLVFARRAGQVQQGSEESSGEGLGGFGAQPGQVQQGSGEGPGEG